MLFLIKGTILKTDSISFYIAAKKYFLTEITVLELDYRLLNWIMFSTMQPFQII